MTVRATVVGEEVVVEVRVVSVVVVECVLVDVGRRVGHLGEEGHGSLLGIVVNDGNYDVGLRFGRTRFLKRTDPRVDIRPSTRGTVGLTSRVSLLVVGTLPHFRCTGRLLPGQNNVIFPCHFFSLVYSLVLWGSNGAYPWCQMNRSFLFCLVVVIIIDYT